MRASRFQWITVAALLAATVAIGCGSKPEDQLVGTWTFSELNAPKEAPADVVREARITMEGSTCTLGKDKSVRITRAGKIFVEGKWSLTGRDITIMVTVFQGRSIVEIRAQIALVAKKHPQLAQQATNATSDIHGNISADGKTLTLLGGAGSQGSAIYKKSDP